MRIRGNVLFQYSLTTLLVVALVSAVLGFTLTRAITDYQLSSHIRLYPEIVRLATRDPVALAAALQTGGRLSPDTEKFLRDFLKLGTVFRVKLWNSAATIVWSDDAGLIGKKFDDDGAFYEAMSGTVAYELGETEEAENIDERDRGITLQIYTPLVDGGRTVGVLELYEANRDLFSEIAKNTRFVSFAVLAAGAAIYILLFLVFYRSQKAQAKSRSQLIESQNVTIYALAYQAELRDGETGRHLERTAQYVRLLARELKHLPAFKSYLSLQYIEDLVKSAPLHDIGKVGVPDAILRKPGRLTDEEMEVMKTHCELGARVLTRAQQKLNFQSFLNMAAQLAIGHHEKWDGTGYPQGLAGIKISMSARIMALADVYDALRSKRVYKAAYPHEECVRIISGERGGQFDPDIVDAFLRNEAEFRRVSEELAD
jgi:HD-GYP domain-containing protein (c-di-GMP phosphodiesterase class II)